MKKLARSAELVLGVVRRRASASGCRRSTSASGASCSISDLKDAEAGDLVLCEVTGPAAAGQRARRCGARRSVRAAQLQPDRDPQAWAARTSSRRKRSTKRIASSKLPLGEREDLTHLPIVAIDPEDARDHDDAIWAEPDGEGGWNAIVAIADVSFYVRPGSELDREARARGNSVYFPDRVVPMLPEELSADICSLKEGEDRAAMACHLKIAQGRHAQELALYAREGLDRGKHCLRGCAGRDRCGGGRAGRSFIAGLLDARRRRLGAAGAGRKGAEAAVGLLARVVRGAAEARSARARPARAAGDARREGADHLDRAARPARRASAGRGFHDRRQCRRGPRARSEEGAGHVPRPRAAEPREAGRAQGLSRRPSASSSRLAR